MQIHLPGDPSKCHINCSIAASEEAACVCVCVFVGEWGAVPASGMGQGLQAERL